MVEDTAETPGAKESSVELIMTVAASESSAANTTALPVEGALGPMATVACNSCSHLRRARRRGRVDREEGERERRESKKERGGGGGGGDEQQQQQQQQQKERVCVCLCLCL